jgi:hypothetical protein
MTKMKSWGRGGQYSSAGDGVFILVFFVLDIKGTQVSDFKLTKPTMMKGYKVLNPAYNTNHTPTQTIKKATTRSTDNRLGHY